MADDLDMVAAKAIREVIGESRWEGVAFAQAYLAMHTEGVDDEQAAKLIFLKDVKTLKACREIVRSIRTDGFLRQLSPREKTGSAENPITKLFPAFITEQRFLELLDALIAQKDSLSYREDRGSGHSLRDFTVIEDDIELPINVKNAGTRFEKAAQLVGIKPDDCIPNTSG